MHIHLYNLQLRRAGEESCIYYTQISEHTETAKNHNLYPHNVHVHVIIKCTAYTTSRHQNTSRYRGKLE